MSKMRKYPKKLFWRLYVVCLVISLVLDLFWLYTHKFHYHFEFQYMPQFFALFGFIGCILLILIAKGLGFFIVVDEDYYQKKQR
jgi:uncharacterized membrane protein